MGDESVLLAYVVAMVIAMGAAILYLRCHINMVSRYVIGLLVLPVLYWLIGPMVLLVAVVMMPWTVAVPATIYSIAIILLSAHFTPFPSSRLFMGISYYRFPDGIPYILIAIPIVIALLRWMGTVKRSPDWVTETRP